MMLEGNKEFIMHDLNKLSSALHAEIEKHLYELNIIDILKANRALTYDGDLEEEHKYHTEIIEKHQNHRTELHKRVAELKEEMENDKD